MDSEYYREREYLDSEEMVQCDFCSSTQLVWLYPCDDFDIAETNWGSEGPWAACEVCSQLIETEDWRVLMQRSLDTLPKVKAVSAGVIRHCLQLHREFRRHRTGPREAISKKGER